MSPNGSIVLISGASTLAFDKPHARQGHECNRFPQSQGEVEATVVFRILHASVARINKIAVGFFRPLLTNPFGTCCLPVAKAAACFKVERGQPPGGRRPSTRPDGYGYEPFRQPYHCCRAVKHFRPRYRCPARQPKGVSGRNVFMALSDSPPELLPAFGEFGALASYRVEKVHHGKSSPCEPSRANSAT